MLGVKIGFKFPTKSGDRQILLVFVRCNKGWWWGLIELALWVIN